MKKMESDGTKAFNDSLPLMGIIILSLSFAQLQFYLQAFDKLNTQLKLLFRSISDSIAFTIILGIVTVIFMIFYMQMGSMFDDGNNFSNITADYDTHFNDYPVLDHFFTIIIAQIRTAFGDV